MSDLIVPILMPKWGLSMKEGTLAAWHVSEGTIIQPGDEIMDVETDKIANVVEAADGGLLRRCVGLAGEIYPVQALLGVLAPEEVTDAEVEAYVESFETPEVEDEEEAAPTHEFADLEIGRIRYIAREGEGTPVFLIHGFGGDSDNWLFNIDSINAKAPVYAIDLPGHGQSIKKIDNPDVGTMVSAVMQLMDHLDTEKAHLVGHSMGGLIAGKCAEEFEDRVASVTMICSAGLGDEINNEYINGFVSAKSRKELKPTLKNLFADQSLVSRSMVDELLKYKRLDGVQEFLESLSANLFSEGLQTIKILDELNTKKIPVTVIWGAQDAVIPSNHANVLDNAKVEIIADAGHMVQMENSARVNELIIDQI